jgi:glutathione S-transferase
MKTGAPLCERPGERSGQDVKPRPVRLYDLPFSGNGYKVRLALAHLGMRVEYEVVDLLAGETASKRFLAKNPMGQIPVLELTNGTLLRESNSILYWLADGTELMRNDLFTRTRIVQWFCFEQSNIDKVLGRTRFLKRYPDFIATSASDWEQWYATGYRALGALEGELSDREFLVGDSYSVADICLYGYVHCAEEGGFDLTEYPSVGRWRLRVQDQPGYRSIDEIGPVFPPVPREPTMSGEAQ